MSTEQKKQSSWGNFKNPFKDIFGSSKKNEKVQESQEVLNEENEEEIELKIRPNKNAKNSQRVEEEAVGEKAEVLIQQKSNSPTSPPIIDFTIKKQAE